MSHSRHSYSSAVAAPRRAREFPTYLYSSTPPQDSDVSLDPESESEALSIAPDVEEEPEVELEEEEEEAEPEGEGEGEEEEEEGDDGDEVDEEGEEADEPEEEEEDEEPADDGDGDAVREVRSAARLPHPHPMFYLLSFFNSRIWTSCLRPLPPQHQCRLRPPARRG